MLLLYALCSLLSALEIAISSHYVSAHLPVEFLWQFCAYASPNMLELSLIITLASFYVYAAQLRAACTAMSTVKNAVL